MKQLSGTSLIKTGVLLRALCSLHLFRDRSAKWTSWTNKVLTAEEQMLHWLIAIRFLKVFRFFLICFWLRVCASAFLPRIVYMKIMFMNERKLFILF